MKMRTEIWKMSIGGWEWAVTSPIYIVLFFFFYFADQKCLCLLYSKLVPTALQWKWATRLHSSGNGLHGVMGRISEGVCDQNKVTVAQCKDNFASLR